MLDDLTKFAPCVSVESIGFDTDSLEKSIGVLKSFPEKDRLFSLCELEIQPNGILHTRQGDMKIQLGFLKLLCKMLGYPVRTLSSPLPAENVAKDLNTLIQLKDANADKLVRLRTQGDRAFALYNEKSEQVPPYLIDVVDAIDEMRGEIEADVMNLSLHEGTLEAQFDTRVEVGLKGDPSYAGLHLESHSLGKSGFSAATLLKRTRCNNSTVMTLDNGWIPSGSSREDSLGLLSGAWEVCSASIPLLPQTYETISTTLLDEPGFEQELKTIRKWLGKRPTDFILLDDYLVVDDMKGKPVFNRKLEGKRSYYDLFNAVTFNARERELSVPLQNNAAKAAGAIMKEFFDLISHKEDRK